MQRSQRGHTLLEVIVVVAIIGIFSAVVSITAQEGMERASLVSATAELRSAFQYVRMLAIARDRNLAIRFRQDSCGWTWSIYEDRDGDGVRADDIKKKIDRIIRPPRRLEYHHATVGVPRADLPDPLKPGALLGDRHPVRFSSSLCSFSRRGEATNGSIVLTDGVRATILRVHGGTGRIDVYRWVEGRWRVGE